MREYRFVSRSRELNAEGEDQLDRILPTVRESSAPIVIESEEDPSGAPSSTLATQRRDFVVQRMLARGVTDAENRVVIRSSYTR